MQKVRVRFNRFLLKDLWLKYLASYTNCLNIIHLAFIKYFILLMFYTRYMTTGLNNVIRNLENDYNGPNQLTSYIEADNNDKSEYYGK